MHMKKAIKWKDSNYEEIDFCIHREQKELIRLNKYISSTGFCSRREADRYIEAGDVSVDGEIAQMGTRVSVTQEVRVKGTLLKDTQEKVYIALHKPIGVVCTTDLAIQGNIVKFMNYKETIFPVGRLDKDSSGLIIMTNDGDIVNKILRSSNQHEKEYIVQVNKKITEDSIKKMRSGIKIYNPVNNSYQVTRPAKVKKIDERTFSLIISEGLNRQIRRMCTALGYQVQILRRVRVMNIKLEDLPVGHWRYISAKELFTLSESIKDSSSEAA